MSDYSQFLVNYYRELETMLVNCGYIPNHYVKELSTVSDIVSERLINSYYDLQIILVSAGFIKLDK